MRYCTPKKESQPAWKMPQILKAHGIVVEEVKNHAIFMASPTSQLASTEKRKPLHDLSRLFARICGRGSVASIARPTYPMKDE